MYRSVMAPVLKVIRESPAVWLFILSYFCSVTVGFLLLELPFCKIHSVSSIDTLFTAASAVSTTGLATVDIAKSFSSIGHFVVILLVQLGGIGYMVFSSFVILSLEERVSSSQALSFVKGILKQVLIYTAICEIIGTILLYPLFKQTGVENSLWQALFHSISAFCTAGFSLFSSNLEAFKNGIGINIIISFLSLMGALGFFLSLDFFKKLSGSKEPIRFLPRLAKPFVTLVILSAPLIFVWISFTNFGFENITISFFHVISAISTAGFNTIAMGALSKATLVFVIFLMLIGASITGSGSNMKGTNFFALLRLVSSPSSWGQKNLKKRAQIAFSTFTHYLIVLSFFSMLLILIEKKPVFPLLFEAASALCTVGFSMGVTVELSSLGKALLALLMVVGRSGILIFGFALSYQALKIKGEPYVTKKEEA